MSSQSKPTGVWSEAKPKSSRSLAGLTAPDGPDTMVVLGFVGAAGTTKFHRLAAKVLIVIVMLPSESRVLGATTHGSCPSAVIGSGQFATASPLR